MTDNKETPGSGINSKNTQNDYLKEAIDLIEHNIQMEGSSALLYRSTANTFLQRNLKNQKQTQLYVEQIWAQIQESSRFNTTTVSQETITQIAKKTRSEFLKQLGVIEGQRDAIIYQLELEYSLDADQKKAIREKVANIPSKELSEYRLASKRYQMMVQMSRARNEVTPLLLSVTQRLEKLFGTNLSPEMLTILQRTEKTGKIKKIDLQNLWDQLDKKGKHTLLSMVSISISLQNLYEIDHVIFSKEALKNTIRKDIKTNLAPKFKALLDASEGTDIDTILSELEWSDISDVYVSEATISELIDDSKSPLPKKLTAYFQEWLEDQVEAKLQEKETKKKKTSRTENPEEFTGTTSFLDGIREFKKKSLEKKKPFQLAGENLLESPDFLNNSDPLIFRATIDGITSIYLLETDQTLEDTSSFYGGWFITQFDASGKSTHKNYVTANFFINLFEISSSISFEKSSAFFKKNPNYIVQDEVSVEDLDRTPVDTTIANSIDDEELGTDDEEDAPEEVTLAENLDEAEAVNAVLPRTSNTTNSVETEPTFPQTLEAFNAALSKKLNQPVSLVKNNCISIGKPGTNKYNVYRIQSFTETGIILWNGSSAFPPEEISFAHLYEYGVENETAQFKILENQLKSSDEFLGIMQSNSSQADTWKDLEIVRDNNGEEHFDFIDRRFDKVKNKKQYFPGNSGHIVEIISIDNGMVHARVGEKFTQSKKDSEASTAEWSDAQDYPLQYIVQYLNRFSCTPWNNPPREIPSRAVPAEIKTQKGTLKAAFGRLSIHDLMSGSKKFMDEFKHHLQHGNHLQEQRVMLGIAKKIGLDSWNSEWYADFKSQYENGEKKLIEERLETLGKMGTPDRQKSIRASLLNNGTHDYDHWTNALCMIEKHGNLYAGGLQDLEGSWIFFKRIAGIPLDANVNDYSEFQKVIAIIRGKGIDNITEEAVIEEYMKTNSHFPNSQIWRMVKKRVKEGTDGEYTNGGNEAEEFINLDQRLAYAMGKFKSKEYAHGIGAMEKVFEKEGSAYKKQSIAFMLAMSRIPERLPRRLLDKFIPLFDQGQVHSPALAFIKDRKSQEKFREAVRTIVAIKSKKLIDDGSAAGGMQMQSDFDSMMLAIGENTDTIVDSPHGAPLDFDQKMFKKVDNFWRKYGKELQHELTANPQGSIMISETQIKKHAALADYKTMLKTQLGDTNVMKEPGGASFMEGDAGAGVISLKPDKIIDKMGLQIHHGGFSGENLERAIQADFRISMEVIRDKKDMSETDKKEWFKNVYTQYVKKITATSNLKSFLEHPTVQAFNKLGLVPPSHTTGENLTVKIEQLKKGVRDVQLSIAKNKGKLQQIQKNIRGDQVPTAIVEREINELNQVIINETQIVSELQLALRETENTRGQYVAFDENDTEHARHFENQFNIFMGREKPSIIITNTTNNVIKTLENNKDAAGLGGTLEDGQSDPQSNVQTFITE